MPAHLAALVVVAASAAVAVAGPTPSERVRLVPLATGLSQPVFAAQASGEPARVYVVEREGLVRVFEGGSVRAAPFLDLRGRVSTEGERGLLGLAFPADYPRSQRVYVQYSARADGANIVARFRVAHGRVVPGSRTTLLRVARTNTNHNGGHLTFGPDGRLWIGLGDGGVSEQAQDASSLAGKLLTLDVRSAHPVPATRGIGLRNPWRYSFDRATGDLWIGDVGNELVEEVNVLRRGAKGIANFGWDVFEGSARTDKGSLGSGTLVSPIVEYGHGEGCTVIGGYVYRGAAVPSLRGRYVFGDYCSGVIWSMSSRGGPRRVEPITVPSLVSFGESLSGELYAVSLDGTVFRLTR